MAELNFAMIHTASASLSQRPCSRCSLAAADDMDELQAKVAEIKAAPGKGIEPLPEVKPYETFNYARSNQRSPFEPGLPESANSAERRASGREPAARIPRAVFARHAAHGRHRPAEGQALRPGADARMDSCIACCPATI